jgi:hypothetical protein
MTTWVTAQQRQTVKLAPHPRLQAKTEPLSVTIDDTATDVSSPNSLDHRFELRDIDIRFPDGEISEVTGLTASGKTALLVRISMLVD